MKTYGIVSFIALLCYTFLVLVFLASKKNSIIKYFILDLIAMITWTGGSMLMRMDCLPSYVFWFHVSIAGLFLMIYAVFRFFNAYGGYEEKFFNRLYALLLIVCYIVNVFTGYLIKWPEMIEIGGHISFVYDMTWSVLILFGIAAIILTHSFINVAKICQKNYAFKKSFEPIILGVYILFFGHLALLLPIFKGFPIDIIAGILNAGLITYALVRRHLFQLTLLASQSVCYGVGIFLASIIFYSISPYVFHFVNMFFPQSPLNSAMMYAILFALTFIVLSSFWNVFVNNVFIKDEMHQAEKMNQFSTSIATLLSVQDIMKATISMVKEVTEAHDIYICLKDSEGAYQAQYSNQPLYDLSFEIRKDNPIVHLLKQRSSLLMDELQSLIEYRSLWQDEKIQLERIYAYCFIGLKIKDELLGIMILSKKTNEKAISYNDIQMISSISSVASIALKNANLYERVYQEAHTDELTGLINRKYFQELLEEEYQKNLGGSLAFILINIDDFKLFNQLYGMSQGDQTLKDIALILKTTVGDHGYVARYGGKEFAIVLPHFDVFSAKNMAESLVQQIKDMNCHQSYYKLKSLTLSIGISAMPYGASSVKELQEHADLAVYHVKRRGKNGIQIFDTFFKQSVEEEVKDTKDIYHEYESTIFALMAAIDAKDHYTFSHSQNVAYYATMLAKKLGYDKDNIEIIRQAALLHDIGKISIHENILNKKGKLTESEYEEMKGHVEASIEIIRHLPSLDYVIPAVIGHHERYDGRGYPRRIKGEDIPAFARILCIADSFDAMTSKRCYKDRMSVEVSLKIIEEEAGKQFDPKMAYVFIDAFHAGDIQLAEDR